MLPINDFNFVVAGIATFAATVGYACTRRLSTSQAISGQGLDSPLKQSQEAEVKSQNSEDSVMTFEKPASAAVPLEVSKVQASTMIPRKASLKRKVPHDGFDEPEKPVKSELGYPHNLSNIYPPNKRSRTPSMESEMNTPTPSATIDSTTSQATQDDIQIPLVAHDPETIVASPVPEPPRTPSPVAEMASPTPAPPSPVIAFVPQSVTPQAFMPRIATPKPTTPKPFGSPSSGFAAFAGSASPFASVSKPQQSAFTSGRSIWNTAPSDFTTHQNDDVSDNGKLEEPFKPAFQLKPSPALGTGKVAAAPPIAKNTHFTGEEDEDVEMELKGVKLYIKRGDKPFGEVILGHLKLLSHRTTLNERLLFRREPLWKVSMNVRVQPTVRCAFVPEENALKLILKEAVDPSADASKEEETKHELVIYVVKPGRTCSKQDFRDFCQTLVKSSQFKAAPSALSTSP